MKFLENAHLSYCTNIHPAETWEETRVMLARDVLAVRDRLRADGLLRSDERYAIGLRLSAVAARGLLEDGRLGAFRRWLDETGTYVFTINGFPYGSFHGTRVKEQVFRPDWTDPARLAYTKDLFRILAEVGESGVGGSVSTLPGSFKAFGADERAMRRHLVELAGFLEDLSAQTGRDFHLGMEPEPLGYFENGEETAGFFGRLLEGAVEADVLRRRIGVNYDACHFALQYERAGEALQALHDGGIRISKIHLSSALALDPRDGAALEALRAFAEPVYFHQVLLRAGDGVIRRFEDLPVFFAALDRGEAGLSDGGEARVHFHIPLDAEPGLPLRSTRGEAAAVVDWCRAHPGACGHFEIETYTWAVLPGGLQRPVTEQIAGEYRWVLGR